MRWEPLGFNPFPQPDQPPQPPQDPTIPPAAPDYDPQAAFGLNAAEPQTAQPKPAPMGYMDVVKEAGRRGLRQGFLDTAGAVDPFKDRPAEQQPNDEVTQLLQQPLSQGWSNPKWLLAHMTNGISYSSPTIGLGLGGAAGGEALAGPPGALIGGAAGYGMGSALQTIVPAYLRARADGLDHDAAVNRAWTETGIAGAFGSAMGMAPGLTTALKRPLSEALLQIFGIQPGLAVGQTVTSRAATGQAMPSLDELATQYVTQVGAGAAFAGGDAAIRYARQSGLSSPTEIDDFLAKVRSVSQQPAPLGTTRLNAPENPMGPVFGNPGGSNDPNVPGAPPPSPPPRPQEPIPPYQEGPKPKGFYGPEPDTSAPTPSGYQPPQQDVRVERADLQGEVARQLNANPKLASQLPDALTHFDPDSPSAPVVDAAAQQLANTGKLSRVASQLINELKKAPEQTQYGTTQDAARAVEPVRPVEAPRAGEAPTTLAERFRAPEMELPPVAGDVTTGNMLTEMANGPEDIPAVRSNPTQEDLIKRSAWSGDLTTLKQQVDHDFEPDDTARRFAKYPQAVPVVNDLEDKLKKLLDPYQPADTLQQRFTDALAASNKLKEVAPDAPATRLMTQYVDMIANKRGIQAPEQGPEDIAATTPASALPDDRNDAGMYSQAVRAAAAIPIEKGSSGQMMAELKKLGAKEAELNEMGLPQWMDLQGKSVTREAVQQYIQNNQEILKKNIYGGLDPNELPDTVRQQLLDREAEDIYNEHTQVEKNGRWSNVNIETGEPSVHGGEYNYYSKLDAQKSLKKAIRYDIENSDEFQVADEDLYAKHMPGQLESDNARYAGVANYLDASLDPANPTTEEHVLHLGGTVQQKALEDRRRVVIADLNQLENGNQVLQRISDRSPTMEAAFVSGRRRITELQQERLDLSHQITALSNPEPYGTGHWTEPDVVAHYRSVNVTTPQGEKVKVLDEGQSDWGQAIHEGGERDQERIDRLDDAEKAARDVYHGIANQARTWIQSGIGNLWFPADAGTVPADKEAWLKNATDVDIATLLRRNYEKRRDGVNRLPPSQLVPLTDLRERIEKARSEWSLRKAEAVTANQAAPAHGLVRTTDQWVTTMWRSVLNDAALEDMDGISIVPGVEQAKRWGHYEGGIKGIAWMPAGEGDEGKGRLDVMNKNGQWMSMGVEISPKRMRKILGPDLAAQVEARPLEASPNHGDAFQAQVLHNLPGVEVGTHGFRTSYDKIYPSALMKILRQLDPEYGKPQTREMVLSSGKRTEPYMYFPLSPMMKDKILAEGFPVYAARPQMSDTEIMQSLQAGVQAGKIWTDALEQIYPGRGDDAMSAVTSMIIGGGVTGNDLRNAMAYEGFPSADQIPQPLIDQGLLVAKALSTGREPFEIQAAMKGFYSPSVRAVESVPDEKKLSPSQWKAVLTGKGIPQNQNKWSGVLEWLDRQQESIDRNVAAHKAGATLLKEKAPPRTLPKDAVLRFLKVNEFDLSTKVMRSDREWDRLAGANPDSDHNEEETWVKNKTEELFQQYREDAIYKHMEDWSTGNDPSGMVTQTTRITDDNAAGDADRAHMGQWIWELLRPMNSKRGPQHFESVNYYPTKEAAEQAASTARDNLTNLFKQNMERQEDAYRSEGYHELYGQASRDAQLQWELTHEPASGSAAPVQYKRFEIPGGKGYSEIIVRSPDLKEAGYKSHHYGDHEVVHVRYDMRQDNEGRPVAFLHEIQSDIHQIIQPFGLGEEGLKNAQFASRNQGLTPKMMARLQDMDREKDALMDKYAKDDDEAAWKKASDLISQIGRLQHQAQKSTKPLAEKYLYRFGDFWNDWTGSGQLNNIGIEGEGEFGAPRAPLPGNAWWEMGFKAFLQQAVADGAQAIAIGTPDEIANATSMPRDAAKTFYGKNVPAFVEKYMAQWNSKRDEQELSGLPKHKQYMIRPGVTVRDAITFYEGLIDHSAPSRRMELTRDLGPLIGLLHAEPDLTPGELQKVIVDRPSARYWAAHGWAGMNRANEVGRRESLLEDREGGELHPYWPVTYEMREDLSSEKGGQAMAKGSQYPDRDIKLAILYRANMGKATTLPKDLVDEVTEIVRQEGANVLPADMHFGVIKAIEPVPGEKDNLIAVYQMSDGSEVRLKRERFTLFSLRAFFNRRAASGRPGIFFNRFSRHGTRGLAESLRGEVWHEGLHALRHFRLIPKPAFNRLVNHALDLKVLELDINDFMEMTGQERDDKAPNVDLARTYWELYKDWAGPVRDELMAQEAATHLLELHAHGLLTPEQVAPIQDIITSFLNGDYSGHPTRPHGQPEAAGVTPIRPGVKVTDQNLTPVWMPKRHIEEFVKNRLQHVEKNWFNAKSMIGVDHAYQVYRNWAIDRKKTPIDKGTFIDRMKEQVGFGMAAGKPRFAADVKLTPREESIRQQQVQEDNYHQNIIHRLSLNAQKFAYDLKKAEATKNDSFEARLRYKQILKDVIATTEALDTERQLYQAFLDKIRNPGDQPALGGVKAKGADFDKLIQAMDMDAAYEDPDDIWRKTGWMIGPDHEWRFEIDDRNAKLKLSLEQLHRLARKNKRVPLIDVLHAPDLYKHYPQIANMPVSFDANAPYGNGVFIHMNRNLLARLLRAPEFYLDFGVAGSNKDAPTGFRTLVKALIHEVQHRIQNIENFGQGTNMEYESALAQARILSDEGLSDADRLTIDQEPEVQNAATAFYVAVTRLSEADPNISAKAKEHLNNAASTALTVLANYLGQGNYILSAGEREANTAMNRIDLTEDERAQQLPNIGQYLPMTVLNIRREHSDRQPAAHIESDRKLTLRAMKTFGTTEDPREAGYIMDDGRMLDFSGRRNEGTFNEKTYEYDMKGRDYYAGQRMADHREVNELLEDRPDESRMGSASRGMMSFMHHTGAVRWMPEAPGAMAIGMPSNAQIRQILRNYVQGGWREQGDPLIVEQYEYEPMPEGGRESFSTSRSMEFARPTMEGLKAFFSGESDEDIAAISNPQNFMRWFAGSKIINADGTPRIVYHGTRAAQDFSEFSMDGPPVNEETGEAESSGSGTDPTAYLGAHFAKEPEVANMFAAEKIYGGRRHEEGDARVMPVYLSIKKPWKGTETQLRELIWGWGRLPDDMVQHYAEAHTEDPDGFYDEFEQQLQTSTDVAASAQHDVFDSVADQYEDEGRGAIQELAASARREMEDAGFDGVIYQNEIEGGTSYIAFEPTQIKSAISNSGDYSPDDPDIIAAFAGSKAEGADLTAKERAMAMSQLGIDPEEIWQDTGWIKGITDKEWYFEVDTSDAQLRMSPQGDVLPGESYLRDAYHRVVDRALKDMPKDELFNRSTFLDLAKDRFDEYMASLQNTPMSLGKREQDEVWKGIESYRPGLHTVIRPDPYDRSKTVKDFEFRGNLLGDLIDLPALYDAYPQLRLLPVEFSLAKSYGSLASIGPEGMVINPAITLDKMAEVIVHEAQHVIQIIEDWDDGGNYTTYSMALAVAAYDLDKQIANANPNSNSLPLLKEMRAKVKEAQDYFAPHNSSGLGFTQGQPQSYRRIRGEVLARLAQIRTWLTPMQRRNSFPTAQEDTPRDEQYDPAAKVILEQVGGDLLKQLVQDGTADWPDMTRTDLTGGKSYLGFSLMPGYKGVNNPKAPEGYKSNVNLSMDFEPKSILKVIKMVGVNALLKAVNDHIDYRETGPLQENGQPLEENYDPNDREDLPRFYMLRRLLADIAHEHPEIAGKTRFKATPLDPDNLIEEAPKQRYTHAVYDAIGNHIQEEIEELGRKGLITPQDAGNISYDLSNQGPTYYDVLQEWHPDVWKVLQEHLGDELNEWLEAWNYLEYTGNREAVHTRFNPFESNSKKLKR